MSHGNLQTLLDSARMGNRDALNELLTQLRPFIRELIQRQVRHDADASSIVQEVLVHVNGGLERFRGDSVRGLRAWLRTIAAHAVVDHWRKRKVAPAPLTEEPAAPFRPAEAEEREELERILARFDQLPDHYRQVVRARIYDNRSFDEIGRAMGKTDGWARVTFLRAIRQLRRLVGETP